ncbi:Uncharacterized protein TCAP_05458 [Tolypocladium capitatum]|uniref:Integral membrane protein n=1 Tax=Tolypocladium capitatum TaxID=45235 RepID=A0A2K3QAK2_9HYPO|nr:Uncharacterized protein TCAP_05458 [Tolypocladium capitatum]
MAPPPPGNDAHAAAIHPGRIQAVQDEKTTRAGPAATPPPPDSIKLVRASASKPFGFPKGSRFINDLPWVVGLLELANAGDFAANVWNIAPLPIYAIVFMAIGASTAGILAGFAFYDSTVSYRNVCFLRLQRRRQRAELARRRDRGEALLDVQVRLAVTVRELGSEAISRWFMDIFMGSGAMLICAGTYMAIDTADPNVNMASNILTGYLGNGPIALFGLVNAFWMAYIWTKAQGHLTATQNALRGSMAAALVKRRSRNVQVFAIIYGTAAIVGGVGSMLTFNWWWGYVILIPVIASSIFCNIWWRKRVGYTRAPLRHGEFPPIVPGELIADLEFTARAEIAVREQPTPTPIDQFVADPTSLSDVLGFLERHAMLDIFCLRVVSAPELCDALGGRGSTEMDLDLDKLLAVPESLHPRLLEMAHKCVCDVGPLHFRNRERYMTELLGTYYYLAGSDVDFDGNRGKQPELTSSDSDN